jgi:predicted RNA binding protein YcfA (HicA-like mRNA interferase family)
MLPKFRTVSGEETIKNICKHFGGHMVSQKGSHVKIKLNSGNVTIVPNHKEIDRFTLKGVLDLAGISLEQFYEKL